MKTAPRFETLPPYQPIEPFEVLSARLGRPASDILKMDANENPYGPSPRVQTALANLPYAHIYPDPESRALRTALAQFTGVPVENLMAGAGADELIDLLLRVLLEPGDRVLICPPTFGMYAFDTLLNAGQVISVPRREDFSLDLASLREAVERDRPKVIFVANPNNPDGRLLTDEEIEALLALPSLVVLDEAYIEFTAAGGRLGERFSRLKAVPQRDNLVVLRTFSKWAGLAGLRVGYGAFPGWLLPALWKAKQPYNVNVAATAAALASLEDADTLAANVEKIRGERTRLFSRLKDIPYLEPSPSQTNFILCRVRGRQAIEVRTALLNEGILVRYYDTPLLRDCIRVTVGKPRDTDRLARALLALESDADLRDAIAAGWTAAEPEPTPNGGRTAIVRRETGETYVAVELNLDGSGKYTTHTGLPFLDHMLAQLAVHGLFDLKVEARGDLDVDSHHTVEDVALSLGEAFARALGERKGIVRAASALVPMDDTLAEVALDFSGRPYSVINVDWHTPSVGGIANSQWPHFLESFALRAGLTLHVAIRYGRDDHHQIEAIFKGLARSLDRATQLDPRRCGASPSTKGTLIV